MVFDVATGILQLRILDNKSCQVAFISGASLEQRRHLTLVSYLNFS